MSSRHVGLRYITTGAMQGSGQGEEGESGEEEEGESGEEEVGESGEE